MAWIENFLTDRTQVTRVGQFVSDSATISSGVIQGSCLGPILFLLYINDVTSVIGTRVKCKLYADDVKLYSAIESDDDQFNLQQALNRLKQWSDAWQLNISSSKCAVLNIGNKPMLQEIDLASDATYSLGTDRLPVTEVVKDLGVFTDGLLKYQTHISHICSNARRRIGLLFKCFQTRDIQILLKAYITYIRPILEYASCVWSPSQAGLIDAVESVQRRFTKLLPGMFEVNYCDRLIQLGLDSLETRRLRFDLIMAYKIIFGLCDTGASELFTLRTESKTRGHEYKLIVENCEINVRKNFFAQRVVKVWNSLPAETISFDSLSQFKQSLLKIDLKLYTRF